MKLGNFAVTNENIGQETENEVATMDEGQEAVLLEAEAVSTGEGEIESSGTVIDDIEQGLDNVDVASDLVDEAQEVLGSDEGGDMATDTEIISVESLISNIRYNLGVEPFTVMTAESRHTAKRSDLVATLEAEKQSLMARAAAGIKAMMNAVISFFRQLFQNVDRLEKYIEGLKKQVAAFNEEASGDATVASKFSDSQSAIAAMNGVVKLMTVSEQAMASFESKMNATKGKAGEDLSSAAQALAEGNEAAHGQIAEIVFVNNQKLGVDFKPTEGQSVTEGKRLSKSEMMNVINAASAGVKSLKNSRKTENRLVSFGKDILALVNIGARSSTNRFRSEEGKEANKTKMVDQLFATAYRQVVNRFGRSVPSFAFKNVKAAADYVKASLS